MPLRSVWRALTRFEAQKIVPEVAIRNTIGFACALILGTLLASPATGVVAGIGALNVCYSDGTDPYPFRARRMLIATALVGVAVVLGSLSAHSNVSAVTVGALGAFAAGMVVALGTTAGDIGVVTLVTLVVFAAKPLPAAEAVETGAVAVAGGLLQTLLSTFLWAIRRYEPERRIIGAIYGDLARIAKDMPSAASAPPMTLQILDAREAIAPLAADHSGEAERQVFLLVQAERIRLSLLNAGRLRRRLIRQGGGADAADRLGAILEAASTAIECIGQRVLRREIGPLSVAINRLTKELAEFHGYSAPADNGFYAALVRDAQFQSVTLRSQIRSAAWAASGNLVVSQGAMIFQEPWRLRFDGYRARLLANFSLDCTVFRHAVRLAVCLALGDTIGRSVGLQRTYWIPMTIAIVLKPDFTGTFARGVLRIGGTMAGLVLATLLFRFMPFSLDHGGVAADIALMALFTLMLRWAGPANYGIFVIAVSGLVVLMISMTGVAPGSVIAARAMNTALGGSLALLAYGVWPTWEKTHTRAAMADMLDSYRTYTHAVLSAYEGAPLGVIDAVRTRARRARSNAQASVDRTRGEPGVTIRQAISLNTMLVHSHSFVHAAMAMEARLYQKRRETAPAWLPAFGSSVEQALRTLSAALRSPGAGARRSRIDVATPPPGTGGNEIMETEADRMRTSLRSLGEEIAKRDWL